MGTLKVVINSSRPNFVFSLALSNATSAINGFSE